jgi:hypothetical protein
MYMRTCKNALLRIALASAALFAAYAAMLAIPRPLFPFSVRAENLALLSDRDFSPAAGKRVLELAGQKLARSPLYSTRQNHSIFICNARWRQMLFFSNRYGAGGVAPYPLSVNVFLRDAIVEDDRLISPRGIPVAGDRTLDYFVAHEVTHQLTGEAIGPVAFLRLPQWVREGYADYVGKGSSFDYQQAKRAFLAKTPEMDFQRSGLYWRFHLLVAYLLDRRHWTVDQLLNYPPSQSSVEAALRDEMP